ncbi:MAG: hypothetical protein A3F72_18815 [Bacteroidetes bacterium RIFCSPLOWO2_12_FULL_35_15]|nr:MAG: hypothetical protein A3F72_18815 [Bacteroidetes bacterium RIFCSPLOWO2_12_FULL_35_15]
MKKQLSLFLFLVTFQFAFSQTKTNYWILFKDKDASPFTLTKPSDYLSAKAIERRTKQNIPVSFTDLPVNPNYINTLKSFGVSIINQSKWFNAILVSTNDENKIDAIRSLAFVKQVRSITISQQSKVSSKFELENNSAIVPNEKSVSTTTSTTLNYGLSFKQANQIGVDCLHDLGFQGQGMTIAVLDAGYYNTNILPVFDSLNIQNQILGCRDFVIGDTLVYEDFPHGMNVLSCMGGNLPGRLVGTSPKAKFWLLRTEDAASESIQEEINWLVGAEFADSVGADLITSSLGYNLFDNAADNHTYADMDGNTTIVTKAADWAVSKGMFVVIAAGNAGGSAWSKITAPGDADSVLTIGAVDSLGFIGSFSSRGPTSDFRIKPNTVARGVDAIVASQNGDVWGQNGTSFATPITAGAVACLWQANPAKTNMEILNAIQQSASQYFIPDTIKGFGIPDFCAANQLLAGIDENMLNNENLIVYPNPFSSTFEISFYSDKKQIVEIELLDISGRTLISQTKLLNGSSTNQISISEIKDLSNGIYIVHLKTPERRYFKKIIKN